MARQSEFPRLNRWSRAVLAVVLAGLVLAASPVLGKSYLVSDGYFMGAGTMTEGWDLDYNWDDYLLIVSPNWKVPLMDQSRGDSPILIDEHNIPFDPGYLVLFERTFPYIPYPGMPLPVWQHNLRVTCEWCEAVTAEGALTNQYLGSDGLTIKICKINDAGTVKFKLRVDFIQRWILDGPYDPGCAPAYHGEIETFTNGSAIISNNLEDFNGLIPGFAGGSSSNLIDQFSWSGAIFMRLEENITGLSGILTDKKLVYVPRGGTAVFKVKLAAQPASDTVVSVARVGGIPEITVAAGSSLTFTPGNWDTYQAVTLAATADNNNLNGQATIGLSAASLGAEIMAIKKAATSAPITQLLLAD